MRDQAGRQMASQTMSPNCTHMPGRKGAFREYIGRPDARGRGGRPNYSDQVKLVDSIHGNTVKATGGTTHSLQTVRPVDKDAKDVRVTLRLEGSNQMENKNARRSRRTRTYCRQCWRQAPEECERAMPTWLCDRGNRGLQRHWGDKRSHNSRMCSPSCPKPKLGPAAGYPTYS